MLFSKNHIWLLEFDSNVKLGISDYAQTQLGTIIFLNLPDIGESIYIGKRIGDLESLKTVSDLISPVSGIVVAVNSELIDDPEAINRIPYDSWLVCVDAMEQSSDLLIETAYNEYLKSL